MNDTNVADEYVKLIKRPHLEKFYFFFKSSEKLPIPGVESKVGGEKLKINNKICN